MSGVTRNQTGLRIIKLAQTKGPLSIDDIAVISGVSVKTCRLWLKLGFAEEMLTIKTAPKRKICGTRPLLYGPIKRRRR